jgi:hypothetical protein
MSEPRASRPYMPGYGVQGADEGAGLLPWAWAQGRLEASRNYWVTTLWPDGRPHSMPVWGVWDDEVLWFSSSLGSRKARNVAGDPRCVIATEDANEPVVLEGRAEDRGGARCDRAGRRPDERQVRDRHDGRVPRPGGERDGPRTPAVGVRDRP